MTRQEQLERQRKIIREELHEELREKEQKEGNDKAIRERKV